MTEEAELSVLDVGVIVAKKAETMRVDADMAELVRKAAALKGKTIIEYLRDIVVPLATRDIQVEAKKLVRKEKPE